MILQWAETHFSAAHRGEDGKLHGHTWKVRAHWPYDGTDITVRRERLQVAIGFLDHELLPDGHGRAEEIAPDIGRTIGACRVDIWREAEGLGATWHA